MKTTILAKNPTFFSMEFRADLKAIGETSESVISEIGKWLGGIKDVKQFSDNDAWIPLLQQTGLLLEELQKIVGPVVWMTNRCVEENTPLKDLVGDLIGAGILAGKNGKKTGQRVLKIGQPIEPLLKRLEVESSPELPLLHIKGFRTQCVFVSEFDKRFDVNHDQIQTYKPSLKSLHPRLTLQVAFHEDVDPMGILLTVENVMELRTILESAEIQMKAALQLLSPDKVVMPKSSSK